MLKPLSLSGTTSILLFGAAAIGLGVACTLGSPLIGLVPPLVLALLVIVPRLRLPSFLFIVLASRTILDASNAVSFVAIGNVGSSLTMDALNPAGLLSALIIALSPFLIGDELRKRRLVLPSPVVLHLALTAWGAVSLIVAEERSIALAQWLRLLSVGCFAVMTWFSLQEEGFCPRLWWAVAVSSLAPLAAAAVQVATGTGNQSASVGFDRAFGTFVHPNPFGHYLVLSLIATYGLLQWTEGRWRPWLLWLGGAQGAGLVLSFSRGAWLAGVAAAATLFVLTNSARVRVFVLVIAAFAIALITSESSAVAQRLDMLNLSDPAVNSGLGRLLIWQERLQYLVSSNYTIGTGIGSANVIAERYSAIPAGTHNDHLRVLLELGVGGFVLWIGLFFAAGRGLWDGYVRSAADRRKRSVAVVGFLALSAYLVGGSVENLLTTTAYQWYLWALILPALSWCRSVLPSAGAPSSATKRRPRDIPATNSSPQLDSRIR